MTWNDGANAIWYFLWIFAFVAYLFALFAIISDLFRDHSLSGWAKAIWVVFLIFVPYLTVFVYLIARGRSMQDRRRHDAAVATDAAENYIRKVVHVHSPAEEITRAKALLDDGVITPDEYDTLKARALAG